VIRAFIAVEIAPKTVESISEAIGQLKLRVTGVRWIPLNNLHVTLKFLGDIDEAKVDPIAQALRDHLRPFSRFIISAKGLGVFPDLKRPRVLWVGLEAQRLAVLASTVEKALEPLGFSPEKRGFQPHLTIGRWRESEKPSAKFGEELARWKNHEFGQSEIKVVILFQSMLKPEGAIHRPLKDVALSDEKPLN
jgi:RNA 2',3'-cyclic 3'-phosphodiesterase